MAAGPIPGGLEARLVGDFVLEGGASSTDEILGFVRESGCCTLS